MRSRGLRVLLVGLVCLGALTSAGAASADPKYFRSPTGNIICGWLAPGEVGSSQAVVCATYNDSFGALLQPTGRALSRYVAADLPGRPGFVLRYGRFWSRGAFDCTMDREDGVVCLSRRSGHGFQLNRTHFTRFRN